MANLECFAFCGNVSLKRNVFINDSCFVAAVVAAVVASEVAAVTTVVASVALAVDEKFQRLSVSLTTWKWMKIKFKILILLCVRQRMRDRENEDEIVRDKDNGRKREKWQVRENIRQTERLIYRRTRPDRRIDGYIRWTDRYIGRWYG
jgi:hypothetical protein